MAVEKWQIEEKLGDLRGCLTENGKKLSGYDDYDRFVTNYDLFVPVDEAHQCVKWQDALVYIQGKGLLDEFIHLYIDSTIRDSITAGKGFKIETDTLHQNLIDYITDNEDTTELYFQWLWSE